jgi:hypothetical protein
MQSQTSFRRQYKCRYLPRSTFENSFAGFRSPIPNIYFCHSSCKLLGRGVSSALSSDPTPPSTRSPIARLVGALQQTMTVLAADVCSDSINQVVSVDVSEEIQNVFQFAVQTLPVGCSADGSAV